eukprot:11731889-Heterocapsa_arctica.AAC.2
MSLWEMINQCQAMRKSICPSEAHAESLKFGQEQGAIQRLSKNLTLMVRARTVANGAIQLWLRI